MVKLTPGRVAFNIVMGVDNESDDFDFLSSVQRQTWEDAVVAGTDRLKNFCSKCGHPWLEHEFAVPAPYCPVPCHG